MNNNIKKGLIISGIFSAESPDKSGELLSIAGMDVTSLNDGTAILNSEHEGGKFSNYLGRILHAKKIFKEEDCSTEHERKCFESVGKNPILYGAAELFDDENHTEAKNAAAVIKHYKKNNLPLVARFSAEGSSLDKEGGLIKRSIIRRVALTISPANSACETEVLSELSKSEKETYSAITKSYDNSKGVTTDLLVIDESEIIKSLNHLQDVFQKLQKALEAGMPSGSPGTLTQGAALQKLNSHIEHKKPKKEASEKSDEATEESKSVKPADKKKLNAIDAKAKDFDIKEIKLKKAEVFILKNLKAIQKPF